MRTNDEQARDAGPYLSIVIPAYNEAALLSETLRAVLAFLDSRPYSAEVIVVDDGSTDETATIAESLIPEARGRVLRELHRGKGAAVRVGMHAACGARVLFSDADLAVPIAETERLLAAVEAGTTS